jgi:hypothetical protein
MKIAFERLQAKNMPNLNIKREVNLTGKYFRPLACRKNYAAKSVERKFSVTMSFVLPIKRLCLVLPDLRSFG